MDIGHTAFILIFAVTFVIAVNKAHARYRAYVRRREWLRKTRR